MEAPIIITLKLDDHSFSYFDRLRKLLFPPERNFLSAHLTLFHHLPSNEAMILEDITKLASKQDYLQLAVTGVVSIGKGVAYKMECQPLQKLHKELQDKWQRFLIPQDKQKLWPHVTVQNKVAPEKAKQTLTELQKTFAPFITIGTGFNLWSYEGGPWEFIDAFAFNK